MGSQECLVNVTCWLDSVNLDLGMEQNTVLHVMHICREVLICLPKASFYVRDKQSLQIEGLQMQTSLMSKFVCDCSFLGWRDRYSYSWKFIDKSVELPQGLVDLSLPKAMIPAELSRMVDGLTLLTYLDCQQSGYYPPPSLTNLQVYYKTIQRDLR